MILDTDPALGVRSGDAPRDVDDGLAIIEALNATGVELLGITVVFGNSELTQGLEVARELVALKGRDTPVVAGAMGPSPEAGSLPLTAAARFMAEQLRLGRLKIVAIGPLTNVASLLTHFPEEARNIEELVVVMGRRPEHRFFIGKAGPLRDFNFFKDPRAARQVVESGVPMALTPFELSVQATITPEHLQRIRNADTPSAHYLYEKSLQWVTFWMDTFPEDDGFHPWDSAAMAYLLARPLLHCELRGYRFRDVADTAQGVANAETGVAQSVRPWFELDATFNTRRLTYCPSFVPGKKEAFVRAIVANVH